MCPSYLCDLGLLEHVPPLKEHDKLLINQRYLFRLAAQLHGETLEGWVKAGLSHLINTIWQE